MQDQTIPLDTALFTMGISAFTVTATLPKVGIYLVELVGKVEGAGPKLYIEKAEPFTVNITNNCLALAITPV